MHPLLSYLAYLAVGGGGLANVSPIILSSLSCCRGGGRG